MEIRNITIDDAKKFQIYFSEIIEENLLTMFQRNEAPSVKNWEKFIEKHTSSNDTLFLVIEHNNEIIGALNFSNYTKLQCSHAGSFTVTVTNPWRSKGLGTSLIKSLIEWVNKHEFLFRIELEVFSNNQQAIRLYERLGFSHEGVKRKAVKVNNKFIDLIQMAWLKT